MPKLDWTLRTYTFPMAEQREDWRALLSNGYMLDVYIYPPRVDGLREAPMALNGRLLANLLVRDKVDALDHAEVRMREFCEATLVALGIAK